MVKKIIMWSYYGAKTNIVHLYPPPKYGKIIEPFAGTARYALKYWDREVLLVDKYDVIIKIWKWLQLCSPGDVLKLPRLKPGQTLDDFKFDCQEAKWLAGFLVKKAIERPAIKPTNWVVVQRPNFMNFSLSRIAKNLPKIKHWVIVHGCYSEIKNQKATWFIDPPYEFGGHVYKESSRKIDFAKLAEWSRARNGQVIVCENTRASWMDFIPVGTQQGCKRSSTEAMWTNEPTSYGIKQSEMFI
jgi:hypothetical protein